MTDAIISYTSTGSVTNPQVTIIPRQADNDEQMVGMWLHGRPQSTKAVYLDAFKRLWTFTAKALREITLRDLQDFSDSLAHYKTNTRNRIVSSIKSLFTFAHTLGYIVFNTAAMWKIPKVKDELAARILTEDEVMSMIHQTTKQRDRVLIRLLYASGGRISEIAALKWVDMRPSGAGGQVTLFGKGGKTRAVKLSVATWKALHALRGDAGNEQPVFVSQKGGRLDEVQIHRIVKAAALRAGIAGNVSAHWLRHSHASHALDRGANIALVRDTLGHSSLTVTSRYVHARPNDSSAMYLGV